MLRTNLDLYRTALLLSLGLGTSGCGGDASTTLPAENVHGEEGEDDALEQLRLPEHLRCTGETLGADPGLRECENGIVHRAEPLDEPACTTCGDSGPILPAALAFCASDAECEPGLLCIASSEEGYAPADLCRSTPLERNYFACQTPEDECGSDAQCGAGFVCNVSGGGRQCVSDAGYGCPVPGRPFLVDAQPRTARLGAATGWCGAALRSAELGGAAQARVAQHWCQAALLEHASIAAFSRFTLQLLALGAPYGLIAESQRAMADETEHARLCFELASRYAGTALGPGPLPIEGALCEPSLVEVLRLVFREGCVGETVAALQATEALAVATDAEVRRTLERIAADERRHAELAWRFVAWALEHDLSGEAHGALRSEIELLRGSVAMSSVAMSSIVGGNAAEPSRAGPLDAAMLSESAHHGVLEPEHERRLTRAAQRGVVLPCAERVLGLALPRAGQLQDRGRPEAPGKQPAPGAS